jgi:hypothetical protein
LEGLEEPHQGAAATQEQDPEEVARFRFNYYSILTHYRAKSSLYRSAATSA